MGIKGRRWKEKRKKGGEKGKEKKQEKIGNEFAKKVQILAYAHALKQNILQFTTESGLKSSLIVKKRFRSKV